MQTPNGYEFQTTFWEDFTIADRFGIPAIIDTFNRAFNEWKDAYIFLTELVIVMNWKIWEWYEKDKRVAEIYNGFYEKANKYALKNLKGKELEFFFSVTD